MRAAWASSLTRLAGKDGFAMAQDLPEFRYKALYLVIDEHRIIHIRVMTRTRDPNKRNILAYRPFPIERPHIARLVFFSAQ